MTTLPADPTVDLVAETRRLDHDVDLVALAGDDGLLFTRERHGFAGLGTATTIAVPRPPAEAAAAVYGALDAIAVDDALSLPGTGPVALGALPFSPAVAGTVTVPEVLVGRADDGTRWLTVVAAESELDRVRDRAFERIEAVLAGGGGVGSTGGEARAAQEFVVRSSRAPEAWCASLVGARDELRAGAAAKVVLARELTITADAPFDRRATLARLRAAYPSCMLFAVGSWVGASPELLVARVGDIVRSHPMAGTAPRSADPSTDARLAAALLSSAKDREEHRITIDMVHDTLLPWCSYLDEEAEPSIVAMANVQHLATLVEGRLSAPAASAVELMAALHPTPAVCGSPRGTALELIDRYEDLDRGCYAGPVGWVDRHGNGEWAVGIRSAELAGERARLFAGVGVVADSDPAAELAETQAKFQALLSAVLRP